MKNTFLSLICICLSLSASSQTLFQNTYGDTLSSYVCFAASPDAYYLLHNKSIGGAIPELIKTDHNGNILWTKTISFSVTNVGVVRMKYSDNELLIAGAHQNLGYKNFFAKLDTAGNVVWTTEVGYGDINIVTRIHPRPGGYVTIGQRDYIGSHSSYTFDITLAAFDSNGVFIWGKSFGDNSYDFTSYASLITSNGDILIGGTYGLRNINSFPLLARFDSNGDLLWMKTFEDTTGFFTSLVPTDITETADGYYAISATSYNTNFNLDAHVIKINDAGNMLWSKRLYQIGWHERAKSVLSDSQGNIVMAGPYHMLGAYGDYFAKLDTSGALLSATKIDSTTDQLFNQSYGGLGEDLYEVNGVGYVYSTSLKKAPGDYHQSLITTDYAMQTACTALNGNYAFSIQDINWTPTVFTNLPVPETPFTASAVTFTTSALPNLSEDICLFVSINENTAIDFDVFPNPASGIIYIQSDEVISEVKLMDVTGKCVLSDEVSGNNYLLDVGEQQGVYVLEVRAGSKTGKKKVMVY